VRQTPPLRTSDVVAVQRPEQAPPLLLRVPLPPSEQGPFSNRGLPPVPADGCAINRPMGEPRASSTAPLHTLEELTPNRNPTVSSAIPRPRFSKNVYRCSPVAHGAATQPRLASSFGHGTHQRVGYTLRLRQVVWLALASSLHPSVLNVRIAWAVESLGEHIW
jgi:hypothetical protein